MTSERPPIPVPALIALVLIAAVTIGLLLPGPAHRKAEPRSSLQTISLRAA